MNSKIEITLIALAFGIGYLTRMVIKPEQCPKEILGYECGRILNKSCDHSRLAVLKAELAMEQRRVDSTPGGDFKG